MTLTFLEIAALLAAVVLAVVLGLLWRRSGLPLGQAVRRFLAPPVTNDEADQLQAGLLTAILQGLFVIILILVPVVAALRHDADSFTFLVLGAWANLVNASIYLVARRHLQLASWLLPLSLFVMVTAALWGGTGLVGLSPYLIVIVSAGLLLGGQGALVYALLSSLAVLLVFYAAGQGWVDLSAPGTGLAAWVVYTSVFAVVAQWLQMAYYRIGEGRRRTRQIRQTQVERNREPDEGLRQERRRARQMELLASITRQLTGLTEAHVLLDRATRHLVEVFSFDDAAIFLVEGQELVLAAAHSRETAGHPIGWRAPLGDGVVGRAAQSGATQRAETTAAGERLTATRGLPRASELAVPLRLSKSIVGVLEVASAQLAAFDQTDVVTLESLADLIVAGLQTSQLFDQLRRQQALTESLRQIGLAVNASLDSNHILEHVCADTRLAFEAGVVEVWLFDAGPGGPLRRAAVSAADGPADLPSGPGSDQPGPLVTRAAIEGRAHFVVADQAGPESRLQLEQLGQALSLIIGPLANDRRPLGVLVISENQRSRRFTAEEAAAAELLAAQLASAITNARLYEDHRRQVTELSLLNDITRLSLEIADFDGLVDALADRLSALIGADGCYLALWDEDSQTVTDVVASSGLSEGQLQGALPLLNTTALTAAALLANEVIALDDFWSSSYAAAERDLSPKFHSVLSLPLSAAGHWLGAAHLAFRRPHHFVDDELAYASRAGRQVALAMAKARTWQAERQRNAELETLRQASLHVTSSLDVRQVLEAILQQTLHLAGASDAHIFLYDGQHLEFGAAAWSSGELQPPFIAPRAGGLTENVARTAERIVIPQVDVHPLFRDWHWGGAIIGMPLRMGSRVCGVMNVAFDRPRHFDEHELRVLDLLADQATVALENARLFKAEREQRSLAEALREASVALSSTLEYEALLSRLLDQIERVLPFDAAAILVVGPGGSTVEVTRTRGYDLYDAAAQPPQPAAIYDIHATPSLRKMADTTHPLIIADLDAWSELGPIIGVRDLHAWAGVPIAAHQQMLAFFVLQKAEVGFYHPDHADRLSAFAGQAALALQNARLFEAERRRAAQLALLSEVSQQIASTLDEQTLLQNAVSAMVHRLGFIVAAILLPAGERELVVVAIAKSDTMVTEVGFRQQFGVGIIGRAAELRATYVTNDVGRDPYYFDPAGRSIGSALALPLVREAALLGMLYVESNTPSAFSAPDVVAFETLANHLATALQNARHYAKAASQLREVMAVQSVSETIVSSLELDNIIATVVQLLHDTFGYSFVSLYVLRGGWLYLKSQVGYPPERIIDRISVSTGVSGRAVRTRQAQFVRDVHADADFLFTVKEVQSEICIPLVKDRDVLGILNVESSLQKMLTEADVRLLSTLASQVTVALDNARLFEAEREQRELAEALRRASLALSATLDLETLLDRLLEEIASVVPYDAATIFLVEGGRAVVARQSGFQQFGEIVVNDLAHRSFMITATPNLAQMASSGEPLIIPDTAQEPGWVRIAATEFLSSWAGAPVMAQGQVLAFFSLNKREPDFYRPEQATRLAAFAGQATLALQNAQLFADQRRRTEEQRRLVAAVRDFSAALSETAVLEAVVRHMTATMESAGCTVSFWDRQQDAVYTLLDFATQPVAGLEARGAGFALADYPATRQVLETRQPLVVDVFDPQADPAERALLSQQGYGARLMAPLYSGESVFGLVELHRAVGAARFTETDQQLAQNLAVQAAVALENARLHAAVQEKVRELDALLTANTALLSTLELDSLLHNILAAAIAAIPTAEMGTICLADPAAEQLCVRAAYGYADPRMQTLAFSWNEGYAGQALLENQPRLINDTAAAPTLTLAPDIAEMRLIRSAMVAPLVPKGASGEPQGVISLDATRLNAFSAADLRILVAFANTAAVAIDNARLHAEVQRLAVTDSLTGLANPRAFEHALATESHRAGRYGHPLSLIIMDIDSFKQYNDTFGHLAGNERLKAIAGVLHETVRDPDLPVRYGGEEFALLLPHTSKAGAISLAERIRDAAQAAAPVTPTPGQPASGYTLSLGVATYPVDALTAEDLMLAADNAELAAKRAGKNRVCAAPPLPPA